MKKLEFSEEEKSAIVDKVKRYFDEELQQEIGGFEAEFLIDFFAAEVGAYFYNRGLADAHALLAKELDEFADKLYELEQPTEFKR